MKPYLRVHNQNDFLQKDMKGNNNIIMNKLHMPIKIRYEFIIFITKSTTASKKVMLNKSDTRTDKRRVTTHLSFVRSVGKI